MKNVFVGLLCFCALALVAVGQDTQKAPEIAGKWIVTGGISKGKPIELPAKISMTAEFKEGKYSLTVAADGKTVVLESGTYKVTPNTKPLAIDLKIEESVASAGKDKGKTQLGIFKVDGDKLTLAVAPAGATERPKNFEGGADTEVTEMKRAK